ncbi:hypothetical protein CWE21_12745 [Pseudidiomarina aquimaris]|uniref:Uncharacterized protein n=1 Tax=Pseudidiomarina aquimaris TaxID=641841 RepID=A0A432XBI3_9GAMM|nr:hypothetical protein [Pseudidiomarina aquimaris]RUO46002.1 hypothetical protein CWE21_12745 [Pseudidiomarina aquimaris]
MRFVLGYTLALTTVIAIWLLTQSSPLNAPTSSASAHISKKAQELDEVIPTKARPETQEKNSEAHDTSVLEQALQRHPHVAAHELGNLFKNNPELKEIRVDFIIALIERGDMAADELIEDFQFWGSYTVAHSAVGGAHNDLTLEQFNKLIELGADVNSQKLWRLVMARQQTNSYVLEKWYTHAAIGPELHKELSFDALAFGNTALYDVLKNQVDVPLVLNEEEEKYIAQLISEVKSALNGYAQLKHQLAETSDAKKPRLRRDLINRLQRWRSQAQILQAMSDSESERAELRQVAAQLSEELKKIKFDHY